MASLMSTYLSSYKLDLGTDIHEAEVGNGLYKGLLPCSHQASSFRWEMEVAHHNDVLAKWSKERWVSSLERGSNSGSRVKEDFRGGCSSES